MLSLCEAAVFHFVLVFSSGDDDHHRERKLSPFLLLHKHTQGPEKAIYLFSVIGYAFSLFPPRVFLLLEQLENRSPLSLRVSLTTAHTQSAVVCLLRNTRPAISLRVAFLSVSLCSEQKECLGNPLFSSLPSSDWQSVRDRNGILFSSHLPLRSLCPRSVAFSPPNREEENGTQLLTN